MIKNQGMLQHFKVLDLTGETGLICGKLLADLGADVIKIEPPAGDDARNIGPFYKNQPYPEASLFWLAYNTNKKSVTLNLEEPAGRALFLKLTKKADMVIESFAPGYLEKINLGYETLKQTKTDIIMVSITPYGQQGPYKDYLADDITAWAMGGYMYPFGDEDRPPIRISYHSQAFLHAGAEAAGAAALAIYHREMTGAGQHVDVSVQECVARVDMTHKWDMLGINLKRGEWLTKQVLKTRYIWPCKDGYIMWNYWIGPAAKLWGTAFSDWIIQEGFADEYYKQIKWAELDGSTEAGLRLIEEVIQRATAPTINFLMSHTKKELIAGALQRNLMLYPLSDTKDIVENAQLHARGFWKQVEHPGLNAEIIYPGAWAICAESPLQPPRRAPYIGEHNHEIYGTELGLTEKQLRQLKDEGII